MEKGLQLTIVFIIGWSADLFLINWLVVWSTECQIIVKNTHHKFLKLKVTSSKSLNSPKPKTFCYFCLKKYLND